MSEDTQEKFNNKGDIFLTLENIAISVDEPWIQIN